MIKLLLDGSIQYGVKEPVTCYSVFVKEGMEKKFCQCLKHTFVKGNELDMYQTKDKVMMESIISHSDL